MTSIIFDFPLIARGGKPVPEAPVNDTPPARLKPGDPGYSHRDRYNEACREIADGSKPLPNGERP